MWAIFSDPVFCELAAEYELPDSNLFNSLPS